MNVLFEDLRFSLRQLRKSPAFAVTAVATLALAIGANAMVFSILNAFVLRPLDIPDAQSLYALWRSPDKNMSESYPDYLDLRDRNHSFDSLVAYSITTVGLDTGNNPSRAWGEEATGNYFDALGLKPYLGHFFHAADERGPNSAPYVVLTHAFWHTRFRDDPRVVGQTVQLNKHPFTIVGVAPPGFHGTLLFFHPDFFTPLVNHQQLATNALTARGDRWMFMTMGHLKAGVTPAQAQADLDTIGRYLEKTYPKEDGKVSFSLVRPSLYGDYVGRPVREFLSALMLLAGLILLAACANLGTLFAARAADRSREVALRLALGASRRRILCGLFTEAVLISLLGGAVGILVSVELLQGLSAWEPIPRWPVHLAVNPDIHVYGLALLLALGSGLLFGAVPVKQVLSTNPYELVKAGSLGRVRRRLALRDGLLVVQVAICAVLVTSSLVAVRGMALSLQDKLGFDPRNTMLADTDLSMAGYGGDAVPAIQKRMIAAVHAIPGVEAVGLADQVPLGDTAPDANVFADATSDLRPANAVVDALMFKVSPEYFSAAGTGLLTGRAFTWHDDRSSLQVAVVNRQFARKLFASVDHAVGRFYKMPDGSRVQVVGLAEDGKYGSLAEDPKPVMFLPILQWPSSSSELVVRSGRDPQQLSVALRNALHQVDAGLPVQIETRHKELEIVLFGPRMATLSLGVLGLLGAMLAATGIFGMAAYSVGKRLRELGLRVALGAPRRGVLQAAMGRPFKLLALGSAAGMMLGVLATPVLAFIVDKATPRDPLVMAGVVLAMSLLGLLASWIPARRALSIDPMILLREE
jgi:predicted permease